MMMLTGEDHKSQIKESEAALEIAKKAHAGQVDKAGKPYIDHPMRVAERVKDDHDCFVLALIHDVMEDSNITAEELIESGIRAEIVEKAKILTHDKDIPYLEYVNQIKADPVATRVKLADLKDNMDISRISSPIPADYERLERYKKAKEVLKVKFIPEGIIDN